MQKIMPSQVVQTIDALFPAAKLGTGVGNLSAAHSPQLLGILNLINAVPDELINLSPEFYCDLILAKSTIQSTLETWISRGSIGGMPSVMGTDVITINKRAFSQCPDDYPPPKTMQLTFINDDDLRKSISYDVGAAERASNNTEWKAATVLAGATIEALLLWRLKEPNPGDAVINAAANSLFVARTISKPNPDIERWELHHFIEVAANLHLIKPETASAAKLAQQFRDLIHPGRAARLGQTCDRATAYSALAALHHIIRDIH